MALDFNALINAAQKDVAANNQNFSAEDAAPEYKILYPFSPGSIVFRLLPNNKSNSVQRLIVRHKIPDSSVQWGSKNVICMNAHYGKDCPICKAISNAENIQGRECGAFSKFGFKSRGIAYAYIVSIGPEYKDVKEGDVVLLMYPKSVYTEISNQIVQNAQNLEYIFNQNNGCTFVIETRKAASGFPEYVVKLNVGFNGPVMATVKSTQEEYNTLLDSLPNLDETIVPSTEPENLYNDALAAADLINVTYGCVSEEVKVVNNNNGNTLADSFKKNLDVIGEAPQAPQWNFTPQQSQTVNPASPGNGQPACFGHHDDSNMKCSMCPHEMECLGIC